MAQPLFPGAVLLALGPTESMNVCMFAASQLSVDLVETIAMHLLLLRRLPSAHPLAPRAVVGGVG